MPTPYFSSSGRRPHLWRIRAEGIRELLLSKRWTMCGAYAAKHIRRRQVMVTVVEKNDDYFLCRFQFKDDLWADVTAESREHEASLRRSTFKVVQGTASEATDSDSMDSELAEDDEAVGIGLTFALPQEFERVRLNNADYLADSSFMLTFSLDNATLLREIAKRRQRLRELQHRLQGWRSGRVRGPRRPAVEGVEKKVAAWLKARHMKDLFKVDIGESDGLPRLHYRFDRRAWQRLQKTLLGKTLIFTDNADWSDAEIVRGYRAQHHVENAFRHMKNPHYIALRPQHHWTDQKIEVHVFCCVLALLLCSLLQRETRRRGLSCSISELLERLGRIREVGVVYPSPGKRRAPTVQMTVSQMTDDQRALYDALDLRRYLAP